MNATGKLADGSTPLAAWLGNAIRLSDGRRECAVFEAALQQYEADSA
jgi:hypothetical protein